VSRVISVAVSSLGLSFPSHFTFHIRSDFVSEPVKGLKKSVRELDPFFLVDGVARGTESLARHTVGGKQEPKSRMPNFHPQITRLTNLRVAISRAALPRLHRFNSFKYNL
jgi:hypothetical protein